MTSLAALFMATDVASFERHFGRGRTYGPVAAYLLENLRVLPVDAPGTSERFDESIAALEAALRARPDLVLARNDLAWIRDPRAGRVARRRPLPTARAACGAGSSARRCA